MVKKLVQKGNQKLGSNILMFNIPANKTVCGRICPGCYAIKEQKRYPTVEPARQARYEATLQPDFVMRMKKELRAKKKLPKHFRIHSSGEFYSQQYINSWIKIAKEFPEITFFTYTKRKKDFDFSALESMSNVVIINSFQFKGLNYGRLEDVPEGAHVCPDRRNNDVQCGETCDFCMRKEAQQKGVFFIKH
jgi:hypothetical protein